MSIVGRKLKSDFPSRVQEYYLPT